MKTIQNDPFEKKNWRETAYFWVEVINRKRRLRVKLGHVVQIYVYRLA